MEMNVTIDELPEEILEIIFDNLNLSEKFKFRRVCERWKQVIDERNLFKQKTLGIELPMNKRMECPEVVHHPKKTDIISKKVFKKNRHGNIPLEYILRRCPNVESLDLRQQTLNSDIISIIHVNCKKLTCLHLNFIKFTQLQVWDRLSYHIMPNVTHLSFDNTFKIKNCTKEDFKHSLHVFFEDAKNLEDFELNIYQMDSLFDFDSLSKLGSKICYAYFKILPSIHSNDVNFDEKSFITLEITESLLEGNGRGIQFLALLTDEEDDEYVGQVIKSLSDFKDLKALHLSCKYNTIEDFEKVAQLQNIKSFTFDFYNLGNEESILQILICARFGTNIERLKLRNGTIKGNTFEKVVQSFPKLKHTELHNIIIINT